MPEETWSWETRQTLPSQTGAGKRLLEEILSRLRAQGWSDHDVSGVHLALEEALVNAIRHGNQLDHAKCVQVCCRLSPRRFWVQIEDEGAGFNPCDVPDPRAPENLERPCGRGLLLMRHFMSRVEYNSKGNSVTMEKQAASVAADEAG